MHPPHQHSRIDLAELKVQIVRKLGPERSKQYFYYLNRLLSLKLSKVEFNKLCVRIFGRENIPLHNQFIRSILKNACSAKVPPPAHDNDVLKPAAEVGEKETPSDNYLQNGCHAGSTPASSSPGLSNGDILPLSPRKARTAYRDRRGGDRRSALGQNGKSNPSSQHLTMKHSRDASLENGPLVSIDTRRPLQRRQGLTNPSDSEKKVSGHHSSKLSIMTSTPEGPVTVDSKDQTESSVREDRIDLYARSTLQAPLGVPFSVGGARRALPVPSSSKCISASNYGALLDSVTLRERMEEIAIAHGLQGVPMDCANMLNNGLDTYLKGIIGSCIELVGARLGHEPTKKNAQKPQASMKLIDGVRTDNHFHVQNSGIPLDAMHDQRPTFPVSLQDFRVAMEQNAQQLGEDWPLLLEKICISSFEE